MSTDRYVKAVLTVIAGCLVYICIALTNWPVVSAADSVSRCVIVGWEGKTGYSTRTYNLPANSSPSGTEAGLPVVTR
jgi:hypothetical protein